MSYSSQNPQNPENPQHSPNQQGGQPRYSAPQAQPHGAPSYGGQNQPMQHQQPAYGAPQGGDAQGQPGGQPARAGKEKGFFAALFDLSFKSFITIKFASILYVAGIVLLTVGWLIITISAFTESAGAGIAMLFLGLIGLFIYIVLFRLMLEFYVAMVRTAQNTSMLVERGHRL